MRKTLQRKGLRGEDLLAYGGVTAAIVFIFALTFGAMDGYNTGQSDAATSTLVAESSP